MADLCIFPHETQMDLCGFSHWRVRRLARQKIYCHKYNDLGGWRETGTAIAKNSATTAELLD
jgi:hypothetical protein